MQVQTRRYKTLVCMYAIIMLYGLILYVSEDLLSLLLCIHNEGMGSFDLHGLILCVSEGFLSEWLCIHNEDMEISDLRG